MAKQFSSIALNSSVIAKEIEDFRVFLNTNEDLDEKKHVLPFFQSHSQLCAMIAIANNIFSPDSIDFEHDLFGDFIVDLIVGSRKDGRYCFIEFEDAKPASLFKETNRSTTMWGSRFNAAFFQIVDWFWKMDNQSVTTDFELRFGDRMPIITPIIIAGRSLSVDEKDRHRIRWMTRNVLIKSSKVFIYTFDDLLVFLDESFKGLKKFAIGDE
jgi:hypothetical protein